MEGEFNRAEMKKLLFRCPDCGTEWSIWVPLEERKKRRWCKGGCKQLVSAYRTEKKKVSEHNVKVTKPKSLW